MGKRSGKSLRAVNVIEAGSYLGSAALAQEVGEPYAVERDRAQAHCDGVIGAERQRMDQKLVFAGEALAHEQRGLVLVRGAVGEEVTVIGNDRVFHHLRS